MNLHALFFLTVPEDSFLKHVISENGNRFFPGFRLPGSVLRTGTELTGKNLQGAEERIDMKLLIILFDFFAKS